jgi:type IV pilus assembly protein PilA
MIKSMKARFDRRPDEGFTLIELMVVVLIIAILMAIAIPTFLSARNTANARAAQSNLRNAVTAQTTQFSANNAFTNSVSSMNKAEPAISWNAYTTTTVLAGGSNVYFQTDNATTATNLEIVALGADNKCYWEWDNNGQVVYGVTNPSSTKVCTTPAYNGFYDNWGDAVAAGPGVTNGTGQTTPAGSGSAATALPTWVAPAT